METRSLLSPGTHVRFDCHKDMVGRVMGIHIGLGNVVTYEVEWDSDQKGSYVSHTFEADRVTKVDLDKTVPIQIGFGGSHPELKGA
jgi:hypothetical protein